MSDTNHCPRCGTRRPEGGALSGLCPACMLRGGLEGPAPFVRTHVGAKPGAGAAQTVGGLDLEAIQKRFPQLEIIQLIGRGGMGLVYKARQAKLDRLVALKIMAPDLANQPAFAERFLREAQALARLSHPNVVAVHDFGERNGMYFLLMEYIDGHHLRDLLEQRKLEPSDALRLVPDICAGLQYAHEEGIVHRDIKPENILVDRHGRAKIADFGLVRVMGQEEDDWRLTRASQVMGTPQYMAPEQLNRPRDVDHRADIYSLGVVLYEMLTAELPVGRFALPSERVRVDVRLDDVVLKALQREPEDRFQQANDMRSHVEEISRNPADPSTNGTMTLKWPTTRRLAFRNTDRWDGLVEFRGLVGIEGDELVLEYRKRSNLTLRNSAVQETRIPLKDISDIEHKRRLFRSELRISMNRLKAAEAFPEMRQGTFRLCFTRKDRDVVERLAQHLQQRIEA